MGESFTLSRKLWEWVVLYEGFRALSLFKPAALGFGVGKEPLPVAFARLGAQVTASDQARESAFDWLKSDQWGSAEHYGGHNLAFREVDMRAIPTDLRGKFDFLWSSCALEHLGGLDAGRRFVFDAMECLKPGGFAFHTTEFNVTSNENTVDAHNLCLYRRKDLEQMVVGLRNAGHEVGEPDWSLVSRVEPPGIEGRPHLSLPVGEFVTTSFFLAVKKAV